MSFLFSSPSFPFTEQKKTNLWLDILIFSGGSFSAVVFFLATGFQSKIDFLKILIAKNRKVWGILSDS